MLSSMLSKSNSQGVFGRLNRKNTAPVTYMTSALFQDTGSRSETRCENTHHTSAHYYLGSIGFAFCIEGAELIYENLIARLLRIKRGQVKRKLHSDTR